MQKDNIKNEVNMVAIGSGQDWAYIRVSSKEQNTDRQFAKCEIKFDQIYEEKASAGGGKKRPVFDVCFNAIRRGDTLHVHSLDRLCRNLADMLGIVKGLNDKGVIVKFHEDKMTFTPGVDDPNQTLQMHLLTAFAEFERTLIRKRQREGIDVALKKGVKFGPSKKLTTAQIEDIKLLLVAGTPHKDIEAKYGVSRQTIYRYTVKDKKAA